MRTRATVAAAASLLVTLAGCSSAGASSELDLYNVRPCMVLSDGDLADLGLTRPREYPIKSIFPGFQKCEYGSVQSDAPGVVDATIAVIGTAERDAIYQRLSRVARPTPTQVAGRPAEKLATANDGDEGTYCALFVQGKNNQVLAIDPADPETQQPEYICSKLTTYLERFIGNL